MGSGGRWYVLFAIVMVVEVLIVDRIGHIVVPQRTVMEEHLLSL